MRLRRLFTAVALAAVAACGLTACQTNVGAAAYVGSDRISESDVNQYIGPNATTSTSTDQNGQSTTINPKSGALGYLIAERLFTKTLAATGGEASGSELDAAEASFLTGNNITRDQFSASVIKAGFTARYVTLSLTAHAEASLLITRTKDAGDGKALVAAIDKLGIPVRVNPRYGQWNADNLALSDTAATPNYLTLSSASTTTTGT